MKYLVIGLVILALLLAAAIGAVSLLENRAGQSAQSGTASLPGCWLRW